jgi:5'-nucleotidase, C-terminal domain
LIAPDWLRADLPAGPLTYAQLFDVEPFGNDLIRMEMNGADLKAVLDQQDAPGQPRLVASGLPPIQGTPAASGGRAARRADSRDWPAERADHDADRPRAEQRLDDASTHRQQRHRRRA